ncbi:MAG: NAD-dependent epimerase/dehydratase family protein [Bacteroidota bacterium]
MPKENKSVFITGASDPLGRQLCYRFLEGGFRVKALKPPLKDQPWLKKLRDSIEWLEGGLLDLTTLEANLDDVQYVIHTAELSSSRMRDKEEMYKTNIEGTANIVNVCLSKSIERFCHISSLSALGSDQASARVDEYQKWQSSDKHSPYAVSKYQAELEVWRAQAEGLPILVLNPAVLIGPGDWTSHPACQMFKYVWEESAYYRPESFDYVDVRDAADITYQLLQTNIQNSKFIIKAGGLTFKSFYEQVIGNIGRIPYVHIVKRLRSVIS